MASTTAADLNTNVMLVVITQDADGNAKSISPVSLPGKSSSRKGSRGSRRWSRRGNSSSAVSLSRGHVSGIPVEDILASVKSAKKDGEESTSLANVPSVVRLGSTPREQAHDDEVSTMLSKTSRRSKSSLFQKNLRRTFSLRPKRFRRGHSNTDLDPIVVPRSSQSVNIFPTDVSLLTSKPDGEESTTTDETADTPQQEEMETASCPTILLHNRGSLPKIHESSKTGTSLPGQVLPEEEDAEEEENQEEPSTLESVKTSFGTVNIEVDNTYLVQDEEDEMNPLDSARNDISALTTSFDEIRALDGESKPNDNPVIPPEKAEEPEPYTPALGTLKVEVGHRYIEGEVTMEEIAAMFGEEFAQSPDEASPEVDAPTTEIPSLCEPSPSPKETPSRVVINGYLIEEEHVKEEAFKRESSEDATLQAVASDVDPASPDVLGRLKVEIDHRDIEGEVDTCFPVRVGRYFIEEATVYTEEDGSIATTGNEIEEEGGPDEEASVTSLMYQAAESVQLEEEAAASIAPGQHEESLQRMPDKSVALPVEEKVNAETEESLAVSPMAEEQIVEPTEQSLVRSIAEGEESTAEPDYVLEESLEVPLAKDDSKHQADCQFKPKESRNEPDCVQERSVEVPLEQNTTNVQADCQIESKEKSISVRDYELGESVEVPLVRDDTKRHDKYQIEVKDSRAEVDSVPQESELATDDTKHHDDQHSEAARYKWREIQFLKVDSALPDSQIQWEPNCDTSTASFGSGKFFVKVHDAALQDSANEEIDYPSKTSGGPSPLEDDSKPPNQVGNFYIEVKDTPIGAIEGREVDQSSPPVEFNPTDLEVTDHGLRGPVEVEVCTLPIAGQDDEALLKAQNRELSGRYTQVDDFFSALAMSCTHGLDRCCQPFELPKLLVKAACEYPNGEVHSCDIRMGEYDEELEGNDFLLLQENECALRRQERHVQLLPDESQDDAGHSVAFTAMDDHSLPDKSKGDSGDTVTFTALESSRPRDFGDADAFTPLDESKNSADLDDSDAFTPLDESNKALVLF